MWSKFGISMVYNGIMVIVLRVGKCWPFLYGGCQNGNTLYGVSKIPFGCMRDLKIHYFVRVFPLCYMFVIMGKNYKEVLKMSLFNEGVSKIHFSRPHILQMPFPRTLHNKTVIFVPPSYKKWYILRHPHKNWIFENPQLQLFSVLTPHTRYC